jgi:hypothetical protein
MLVSSITLLKSGIWSPKFWEIKSHIRLPPSFEKNSEKEEWSACLGICYWFVAILWAKLYKRLKQLQFLQPFTKVHSIGLQTSFSFYNDGRSMFVGRRLMISLSRLCYHNFMELSFVLVGYYM